MFLAAMLAAALFTAQPAPDPDAPMAADAPMARAPATHGKAPQPAAASAPDAVESEDDVPASAPKDDFHFVGWCYGALSEYLDIYEVVKPDLKAIDKLFGTPVVEAEPYSADVAEDRKALKRYAALLSLTEKASPHPINSRAEAEAAISGGRAMWSAAKMQPHRRLADAWLYWGVPLRCDQAAQRLRDHTAPPGPAAQAGSAAAKP